MFYLNNRDTRKSKREKKPSAGKLFGSYHFLRRQQQQLIEITDDDYDDGLLPRSFKISAAAAISGNLNEVCVPRINGNEGSWLCRQKLQKTFSKCFLWSKVISNCPSQPCRNVKWLRQFRKLSQLRRGVDFPWIKNWLCFHFSLSALRRTSELFPGSCRFSHKVYVYPTSMEQNTQILSSSSLSALFSTTDCWNKTEEEEERGSARRRQRRERRMKTEAAKGCGGWGWWWWKSRPRIRRGRKKRARRDDDDIYKSWIADFHTDLGCAFTPKRAALILYCERRQQLFFFVFGGVLCYGSSSALLSLMNRGDIYCLLAKFSLVMPRDAKKVMFSFTPVWLNIIVVLPVLLAYFPIRRYLFTALLIEPWLKVICRKCCCCFDPWFVMKVVNEQQQQPCKACCCCCCLATKWRNMLCCVCRMKGGVCCCYCWWW